MRYIIEVTPEIDAQIRDLISQNKYLDTYQFVARAIEAMLHIERQEIKGGRVVPVAEGAEVGGRCGAQLSPFTQPKGEPRNLAAAHRVSDLWEGDSSQTPWLWGQINSVLCIKFIVRVLATKQMESTTKLISLCEFATVIANAAVNLRERLVAVDENQGRPRDARLSMSFPKNTEKSRERFVSQYLGYLDRNNRPKGALVWLGFARITGKRGSETIALTPAGFHFAKIENAVIDSASDKKRGSPFSAEETQFYVKHVLKHAPCEANAMRTTCDLIHRGKNTPQNLDAALRIKQPKWSAAEAITYKGGALARLYQLGIIAKERRNNGTIVYKLTESAKSNGLI